MALLTAAIIIVALLAVAPQAAMAQPGPYALWATPTSVRMAAPAYYNGVIYAMPFLFSEQGSLPFALGAWNATNGVPLFNVTFTAKMNNQTSDWKGMMPAVTEANVAKAGHPPDVRVVVLFAFHQSVVVYAVDGVTGEYLWRVHSSPSGCGILECEITGLAAPIPGAFIVQEPSWLIRLNAADGHVVWNVTVSGNDGNPGGWRNHVTRVDDTAFIYTTRDYAHRVDSYTGGFLWSAQHVMKQCPGTLTCAVTDVSPAVVYGDYVCVGGYVNWDGGSGGVIVCMWARTGRAVWSAMPANYSSWVAAGAGVVAMSSGEAIDGVDDGVYAYNISTGARLWFVNVSNTGFLSAVAVDPATGNVAYAFNNDDFGKQQLTIRDPRGQVVGSMTTTLQQQMAFSQSGSTVFATQSQSDSPGLTAIYIGSEAAMAV